ncbi:phage capsid protein [Gilliamella sp. B14384H2]|uniref:hypothetical protein n=1 Tax=unclassified Gilliamella TaxID=2685620 RepID=UPI0018DE0B9D|nr:MULTISPECIES: hypothetical protein [unclassified Gilliamella]MBI0036728.1 phage capsid protein [Gilliamella sp. B14384G10]MBI0040660.1 phage capsid protein [Gilliamella sp. B14384G7]MBI0050723.1 phage capsid protein [Gilliamella sp. B14384G13]MBI0053015.1 phage capsid protein [Gilliamella sp. B14384H2]
MQYPFPVDPQLTAITIAYRNTKLIADEVLPRVPVSNTSFKWLEFDFSERFTLPNTKVGRTSKPNQVEFSAKEKESSVENCGLDSPVPQDDIDTAITGYNPLGHAVEATTDLILLDREVRAANLLFNGANYNNKQTLTSAQQWNSSDSDPVELITDAFDSMVQRPNIGTLGRRVATILRRHPKIVAAYHGNAGENGMVPLGFLADLLELEAIYVGDAFLNSAKPGKSPVLLRAWGNKASFTVRNKLANTKGGITFGYTAQFKDRVSGSIADPDIGLRGGRRVRVGESVKEIVVAKDAGYLFENVISPNS